MTVLLQPSSWKERKVIIPSKEMQWIMLSFGQKAKFIEPYDEIKDQGLMLSQEVFAMCRWDYSIAIVEVRSCKIKRHNYS